MFQLRAKELASISLFLAFGLILAFGPVLFGVVSVVDSPVASVDMYLQIHRVRGE